jgi:hypothetical protein
MLLLVGDNVVTYNLILQLFGLAKIPSIKIISHYFKGKSRDSSVGIALGYGLDDQGSGI